MVRTELSQKKLMNLHIGRNLVWPTMGFRVIKHESLLIRAICIMPEKKRKRAKSNFIWIQKNFNRERK